LLQSDGTNWIFFIYAGLLAIAAMQDIRSLKISNIWSVGVLLASLGFVVVYSDAPWWQHLVVFAAVFAGGLLLFNWGWLGGGDAKLMSAAAAWFSFSGVFLFLLLVLFLGGILAVLMIAVRMVAPASWQSWAPLKKRGGIPYGVPIAIGSIAAALLL
jgi:prepilin peptidase CpaA